jgi:hypothetical protein
MEKVLDINVAIEVTTSFLVLHDPMSLIELRETGQCEFGSGDGLDLDYPGITPQNQSVSLTIPASRVLTQASLPRCWQ